MCQIGYSEEGSLAYYEIRAIELADATIELGGRCSGLHEERGRSSSFCLFNVDGDELAPN